MMRVPLACQSSLWGPGMGTIITAASMKGGAGKSAFVTVLSAFLAAEGRRIAVIDADPNRNYARWHEVYEGVPITCIAETRPEHVVDQAQALAANHDVALIDTAGFGNVAAAHASAAADAVIVPVMPDRASATMAIETVRQVGALARAARRPIPVRVIRSRWNPRGLVERALVDELQAAGMPLLAQHLSDLSDFGKFTMSGAVPTVGRLGSQTGKIVTELATLGVIPPRQKARM